MKTALSFVAALLITVLLIEYLNPRFTKPELLLGRYSVYPSPWPEQWSDEIVVLQDNANHCGWSAVSDSEIETGSPNMSGIVSLNVVVRYSDRVHLPLMPSVSFAYTAKVSLVYNGSLVDARGNTLDMTDADPPPDLKQFAVQTFVRRSPKLARVNLTPASNVYDGILWSNIRLIALVYTKYLCAVLLPFIMIIWCVRSTCRRLFCDSNCCAQCGYSFKGLAALVLVCPECGSTRDDRANPSS
jgi:hypothetical protein